MTCENNKIIEEMSIHPIFSLNYPKGKKNVVVFIGSDRVSLSNITPDFRIVIVNINLQVSPSNDSIAMEVISVMLSVLYLIWQVPAEARSPEM